MGSEMGRRGQARAGPTGFGWAALWAVSVVAARRASGLFRGVSAGVTGIRLITGEIGLGR